MDKENIVYTTIFTAIATIIFTAVLSYVYVATKPKVLENTKIARQSALLGTIGISAKDTAELESLYEKYFLEQDLDGTRFQTEIDGQEMIIDYFEGQGLWSIIKGFIAISPDASVLYGLAFTEQAETPGLGGRIEEESFRDQFKNLALPEGKLIFSSSAVPSDKEKGVVDGLTGATRTSESIGRIVDTEIMKIKGGM